MEKLNNPANRLHTILTVAFANKPEKTMQAIWQEIFKLNNNELDKIASIQPRLISLTYDIENRINSIKHLHNKSIYIKPIKKITNAIFNLGHIHNLQNFKLAIPSELMDSLHICSDLLNSNGMVEKFIDQKELDDLLVSIEELTKNAKTINTEPEFRNSLVSILDELKYLIIFYQIHGIESFQEYFERFLGNRIVNNDSYEVLKNSNETKDVYSGLVDTVDKINKLISFAKNTTLALPLLSKIIEKLT